MEEPISRLPTSKKQLAFRRPAASPESAIVSGGIGGGANALEGRGRGGGGIG